MTLTSWHVHDAVVTHHIDAVIGNLVGVGQFAVQTVAVPRRLVDTMAWHAAVRRHWAIGSDTLSVRGGVMLEPAAVPVAMLTAMTVDLPKTQLSLGALYGRGRHTVGLSYAWVGMRGRTVRHGDVLQTNPTRTATSAALTSVGAGDYWGSAHIVGVSYSVRGNR
jgi:hypothetical protein